MDKFKNCLICFPNLSKDKFDDLSKTIDSAISFGFTSFGFENDFDDSKFFEDKKDLNIFKLSSFEEKNPKYLTKLEKNEFCKLATESKFQKIIFLNPGDIFNLETKEIFLKALESDAKTIFLDNFDDSFRILNSDFFKEFCEHFNEYSKISLYAFKPDLYLDIPKNLQKSSNDIDLDEFYESILIWCLSKIICFPGASILKLHQEKLEKNFFKCVPEKQESILRCLDKIFIFHSFLSVNLDNNRKLQEKKFEFYDNLRRIFLNSALEYLDSLENDIIEFKK